MPHAQEFFSRVTPGEWLRAAVFIICAAAFAGIWYQKQNAEGANLQIQLVAQSDLFSDRINSLSSRITSLETKQSNIQETIGTINGSVAGIAKDLSFLAETIRNRGVDRDRQISALQEGQEEITKNLTIKLDKITDDITDLKVSNSKFMSPFGKER